MQVVLALATVLPAGVLLAGAAHAQGMLHPWCEEGRPGDDEAAAVVKSPSPPAAILPCALVDSGVAGHPAELFGGGSAGACADSPFYVVTHAGVLLCQVDVALFAIAGDTAIEPGPSAAPAPSTARPPAAPAATCDRLAPPVAHLLNATPVATIDGGPLDANTWRPPRPS